MNKTITEEQKRKMVALIHAIIPNSKIILFGSQARGTQAIESDIDLAIDANRPLALSELGEVIGVLEGTNLPYSVDIIDFHTASKTIKVSIEKEGIVWSN